MGRVKLEIKRLDNPSNRQSTYSKRKNGILKKAHELSVLCDVDLILIMFSPGGKPSFCRGKHSIDDVIAKFSQLPPQERAKRKLENLEVLKKTFKKLEHDVNIPEYIGTSIPTIKDLTEQAAMVGTRLEEARERLRYWTNPEQVNDLEHLMRMEDSLKKSLEQIQRQKEYFPKKRQVLLESNTELQSLLWGNTDYIQHAAVGDESNLHTQRDIESCTGSNSGSYFGCLSTSSKSEENNSGLLSGIENIGQDTFQGIQFGGQNPYVPSYNNLNMTVDNSFQGLLGMDQQQQQSNMAYDVSKNYQSAVPWHDICSHLAPESPADSAFGDYLNYQRALAASAPTVPSTAFERLTRDSSHILFENTLHHYA